MELDLGPEIARFRAELREWIAAQAPGELAGLADWNATATTGGYRQELLAEALAHPAYAQWERTLAAARLICPQWPAEFGGQDMDAVRVAVLNEEFYRAGVPRVNRGMGEALVGPSIIVHGTPEQRAYFLPRIVSGEDIYCQGFSEPDHGSDLAGVQTRGEVDGEEIVVTGQKVWTSGAARATMMFLLCRTDPAAPKHAGLSYVLISFTGPGVQYRPIRQMSGAQEFCEDFLDGVRTPLFNVIGGLNNGWRVAMTTLGHERGGRATVQHLGFEREYWELVETARKRGKNTDPLIRQHLAQAYTSVQLMRFSGLRTLAQVAQGRQPGPEASVAKLFWSEYHKRLGEIAVTIEGSDALLRPEGPGYPTSRWQNVFLSSRSGTIYSGTSEIQRNIIGERALGLPQGTATAWLTEAPGAGVPPPDSRFHDETEEPPLMPSQQGDAAGVRQRDQVVGEADSGGLVTPARLREFFAPRSIALVGASDTSGWARFIVAAGAAARFAGPLIPVHPVHQTALGRPVARSLRDLAEPPDLAFILVPTDAVADVIEDAAAGGVRHVIVLASGYREVGAQGRVLEERLTARAAAAGITLLGPNCLGFINAHSGAAPFALNVPLPLTAGPVGVALQSGALASVVLAFARSHAIGVSTLTSMGNEAMISTADMLEYLVADDDTRVICLFLEQISDPAAFARAARKADQAGKPIVALKAGSSPAGQRAALAHTGSVAGDDAVVGAVLRQLNVIRVTSIEDLLTTAALLGYQRVPRGRRMGVLTNSGGACDIIADRASELGIAIPEFSASTTAAIAPLLPPFAVARNPLDVTGYGLANQRTSALTAIDRALDAAVADEALDFVLFSGIALPDAAPAEEPLARLTDERMAWLGRRIASSPIPVIPMAATCVDLSPYGREVLGRNGIHLMGGMDLSLRALGHALRWQERRGKVRARLWSPHATAGEPAGLATKRDVPWSEVQARNLLARAGVPLVPGELARSADEAVDAAQRLGMPVAMKICSAQITHKSDIGGVALGMRTPAEVREAYASVRAAGDLVPGARVDGVLVTPMRTGGVELLAGVTVDPAFGPVLTVGLGGVWVEILRDTSLRVLPVDAGEVRRMLGELRGLALLRGARGRRPADLDALAEVISRIGGTAISLNGALHALEVNPLWVNGDQIEALDALVVTGPDGISETEPSS